MIKHLARAGLAIALALAAQAAAAQTFPSKPIKLLVPFGPGAASDAVTRFVAERAAKTLGTNFVIENIAGANGSIAARTVAKAPPDGYTIIVSSNSAHAANIHLYKDVNYDPVKDFAPITGLTLNPHVLVVRSSLPVKTPRELIDYGKANPGKLSFGTGNAGSLANASLFASQTGFTAVPATYRSQPAAVVDLLGDRIDFMMIDYFIVAEHIQAGKLRVLAVTSKNRLSALPDVPPLADTVPGYDFVGWIAAFAPAGTPADVVGKLNTAFADVVRAPEAVAYFDKLGMQPSPTTPEELGRFQAEQVKKWGEVLALAGVEKQ